MPINGLPINGLPINGLQIPGGWTAVLAGTALAGKPLQTITLQQVLALNPQPAAVRNLTLGNLLVADSALGQVTIGALALGTTPINGLGTDAASIETQLQAWCTRPPASAANCSLAAIGNQSLFALSLAGAPINGLPINGLPMNGLPINGLPINGLPINGLNLSASPINGLPINGLPINGLPINGLPAVTLATIVDCTKAGVNCATQTLGQAAAARRDQVDRDHPRPAEDPPRGRQPGAEHAHARRRDRAADQERRRPVGDAPAAAPLGVRHEPPDAAHEGRLHAGRGPARGTAPRPSR